MLGLKFFHSTLYYERLPTVLPFLQNLFLMASSYFFICFHNLFDSGNYHFGKTNMQSIHYLQWDRFLIYKDC